MYELPESTIGIRNSSDMLEYCVRVHLRAIVVNPAHEAKNKEQKSIELCQQPSADNRMFVPHLRIG